MNDRELLELAAKAAGITVIRSRLDDPMHRDMLVMRSNRNPCQLAGPWNPRDDDGDAMRLAVKIGIHITNSYQDAWASTLAFNAIESIGSDPYAATRRAIVRAAAEIGRNMND